MSTPLKFGSSASEREIHEQRLEEYRNAKLLVEQMVIKTKHCRRNMMKLSQLDDGELCKVLMEQNLLEKLQFINVPLLQGILNDSIEVLDAGDTTLDGSDVKKRKQNNNDEDNDYNPARRMDVRAK